MLVEFGEKILTMEGTIRLGRVGQRFLAVSRCTENLRVWGVLVTTLLDSFRNTHHVL